MNGDGPILIMGAMNGETELLVASLTDAETFRFGDIVFWSGRHAGKRVTVCRCLIGTVYAAAATALGIERFAPRAVITCGTAGAHDPSLRPGDVVLGNTLINAGRYNAPHRDEGAGSDALEWEFPEEECFEPGGHVNTYLAHSDVRLMAAAESTPYSGGRIKRGTVLTMDAWNREIDRILQFHERLGSDCEDMESYAVAKVCEQASVPCLAVRIISNGELCPAEGCDLALYGRLCQQFVLALAERI